MSAKYTYNITTDFPNGKADLNSLLQEIEASAIADLFRHLDSGDGLVDLWFLEGLSDSNLIILNALVASHLGDAMPPERTAAGDQITALEDAVTALTARVAVLESR